MLLVSTYLNDSPAQAERLPWNRQQKGRCIASHDYGKALPALGCKCQKLLAFTNHLALNSSELLRNDFQLAAQDRYHLSNGCKAGLPISRKGFV